jgi:hypothetical protein
MNQIIIPLILAICSLPNLNNALPQPDKDDQNPGRGAGIFEKLKLYNPEFRITAPPPADPNVPKKRLESPLSISTLLIFYK